MAELRVPGNFFDQGWVSIGDRVEYVVTWQHIHEGQQYALSISLNPMEMELGMLDKEKEKFIHYLNNRYEQGLLIPKGQVTNDQ